MSVHVASIGAGVAVRRANSALSRSVLACLARRTGRPCVDVASDPHEPESWDAGLELVEEQILTRAPEAARFPQPLRALTRLTARSTALSRQGARVLRYRF
ncbi:hypothetical protein ACWDLG_06110 [Nonomuraea sp. NPDC003727]